LENKKSSQTYNLIVVLSINAVSATSQSKNCALRTRASYTTSLIKTIPKGGLKIYIHLTGVGIFTSKAPKITFCCVVDCNAKKKDLLAGFSSTWKSMSAPAWTTTLGAGPRVPTLW
jgi:hypothetical protein